MIGSQFHKLTVLSEAGINRHQKRMFVCRCECGNQRIVIAAHLRNGNTQSCGCWQKERAKAVGKSNRRHGDKSSREWKSWQAMRSRCLNPHATGYRNYGGRGISICERWARYEHFLEDMGRRPSPQHSLDRIDSNGNYEPGNCRWASPEQQMRNIRTNVSLTFQGKTMTVVEWAEEMKIPASRIYGRLKRGWNAEQALTLQDRRKRSGSLMIR